MRKVKHDTFVKHGVDIGIFIDVFLYFRMRELTNERPVAILWTFQATYVLENEYCDELKKPQSVPRNIRWVRKCWNMDNNSMKITLLQFLLQISQWA